MLDENPEYGLKAPDKDHPNTIWFNIAVEDIEKDIKLLLRMVVQRSRNHQYDGWGS